MGAGRRRPPDLRVRRCDTLGYEGQLERAHPLWTARGRRLVGDHILLRIDQPDDGHGTGARGRRAPAPCEFRWIRRDDRHALHRPPHGARAAPKERPTARLILEREQLRTTLAHATRAAAPERNDAAGASAAWQWTHSSVGRAADS